MMRSILAVAAVVALVPSSALAAPSRAWTAAKKAHADAPIIAGLDVASAKASESFKKLYPKLLKEKPEVKDVLDRLSATCSFDPFTAVHSVVAVIDDSRDDRGAVYLALTGGWDAAKLGDCGKKIAASENRELTVGPIKNGIQELVMTGERDKVYLGWIGKQVLVVATDPMDRSLVQKMLTGKGAGRANKLANKLDTGATAWMVGMKAQPLENGIEMKALYGTANVNSGTVAGDMRVVTGDATQAANLVTMINTELPKVQPMLPPGAKAMVASLKLSATGAEVQGTASAPEKDLLSLLQLVLGF
jgi:hypothetical protein